jgi:hypothetical protein
MADEAGVSTNNTSLYYPLFQYIFEAVDTTSMFWQPAFKAIGRTQLEFASLQARQAQAFVRWSHRMMQLSSPADVLDANAQFWTTVTEQYIEAVPRVAAVVEAVTEAPSTVLPLPPKQARDTLILLDREQTREMERRVA